jgi:hypothetical protein
MSSSQGKNQPIHHPQYSLPNAFLIFRYAEIVNVRLGDGSVRKGQVLEIAGKRAVVQVRSLRNQQRFNRAYYLCRSSKVHQALTTCTLIVSSLVMS